MLEKARRLLGEQQDSSGAYPQDVWTDQFLIDGINQASDRLERFGVRFFNKVDTSLTTTAGTISYLLPAGMTRVDQLFIERAGVTTPTPGNEYTPVSPEDFVNLLAGKAYTIEGNGSSPLIKIYPTPSVTGQNIILRGVGRQTELSSASTSAVTNLPDAYHMFFVWSMVAYARFREEETAGRLEAEQKAEDVYGDIFVHLSAEPQETTRLQAPWNLPR